MTARAGMTREEMAVAYVEAVIAAKAARADRSEIRAEFGGCDADHLSVEFDRRRCYTIDLDVSEWCEACLYSEAAHRQYREATRRRRSALRVYRLFAAGAGS